MLHTSFVTTTRGLRRGSPPLRLYEESKRLEKARGASLEEVEKVTIQVIETEDA